jgi:hypothetical protein
MTARGLLLAVLELGVAAGPAGGLVTVGLAPGLEPGGSGTGRRRAARRASTPRAARRRALKAERAMMRAPRTSTPPGGSRNAAQPRRSAFKPAPVDARKKIVTAKKRAGAWD